MKVKRRRFLQLLVAGCAFTLMISSVSAKQEAKRVSASESNVVYEHLIISQGFTHDVIINGTTLEEWNKTSPLDLFSDILLYPNYHGAVFFDSTFESFVMPYAVQEEYLDNLYIEDSTYNGNYSDNLSDWVSMALPDDGIVVSQNEATPRLSWQLGDYAANNSVRVSHGASASIDFSKKGTYQKLYFLTSGGNIDEGEGDMDITVYYSDGTSDAHTFPLYDWYDSIEMAASTSFARINVGDECDDEYMAFEKNDDGGPMMHQCVMDVNTSKVIKSIEITNNNENTDSQVNVFAVTGVTGDIAAPTNLRFDGSKLIWDEVEDADYYVVDIASDEDFSTMDATYNNYNIGNVTEFDVSAYVGNYIRVRAVSGTAGASASSVSIEITHLHDWQYSLSTTNFENDTILATCSGSCEYHTTPVSLKVNDQTQDYSASIQAYNNYTNGITAVTGVEPVITYVGDGYPESASVPANAGDYQVNVTIGGKTVSANFTVNKVDFDYEAPVGITDLIYNGSAQDLVRYGTIEAGGSIEYSLDKVNWSSSLTAVNADNYTYYWRILADINHNGKDDGKGIAVINWLPVDNNNTTITLDKTTTVYNGNEQEVSIVSVKTYGDVDVTYAIHENDTLRGKDVGTYEIRLVANGNYMGTMTAVWTIESKDISNAVVTLDDTVLIADGQEKTQGIISVVVDGITLTEADYTVSDNKATEDGAHTITITGIGNFSGTATKKFIILKPSYEELEATPTGDDVPSVTIGSGEITVEFRPDDKVESELVSPKSELMANTLDSEELSKVANGDNVSIWVEVASDEDAVADTSKQQIETELASKTTKYEIGAYIDVSLFKKFESETTGTLVPSISKAIKISIKVPANLLRDGRTYYIVRNHNGTVEVLESVFSQIEKIITFETDRFSPYAICYSDPAVISVSLDKTTQELDINGTVTLVATVNPANAGDTSVTWTSSDASVATVNNGVVTAIKAGTATITVTTTDGNKTAVCTITVKTPAVSDDPVDPGTTEDPTDSTDPTDPVDPVTPVDPTEEHLCGICHNRAAIFLGLCWLAWLLIALGVAVVVAIVVIFFVKKNDHDKNSSAKEQ